MVYFIWLFNFVMLLSVIFSAAKANNAFSRMKDEVDKLRGAGNELRMLWSYDAIKLIHEYKRLCPTGRHLKRYRLWMASYFATGLATVGLFLMTVWYWAPVS